MVLQSFRTKLNRFYLLLSHMLRSCCRHEKTRKRTEPDNICIPAKSFAAGPIGPAAKLSWTVSYYLDHSSEMHCCVVKQICKSPKVDCWWFGFGLYWTPSTGVMRTVQLTVKLSVLFCTNHWIYCMVHKKLSNEPCGRSDYPFNDLRK